MQIRWLIKVGLIVFILIFVPLILYFFKPNQQQSPKTSNNSAKSVQKPTPLNYSPDIFQYDIEKAKTLLTQYIRDNIKPEFSLTNIEVKQEQSIDGKLSGLKYEFGSKFTKNKVTVSSVFKFKENTNIPSAYSIFIQPDIQSFTANASLANSLTSSYFLNPYSSISKCGSKGSTSYCEEFKTEIDGKRGFGIVFGYEGSTFIPIVFTCSIDQTNEEYSSFQSCITP